MKKTLQYLPLRSEEVYLSSAGGLGVKFINADYTVLDDDCVHTIYKDSIAASRTVTLPTAADNDGRYLAIINIGATYNCTVDGEGAELVKGAATITVESGERAALICDGTQWHIIWGNG